MEWRTPDTSIIQKMPRTFQEDGRRKQKDKKARDSFCKRLYTFQSWEKNEKVKYIFCLALQWYCAFCRHHYYGSGVAAMAWNAPGWQID